MKNMDMPSLVCQSIRIAAIAVVCVGCGAGNLSAEPSGQAAALPSLRVESHKSPIRLAIPLPDGITLDRALAWRLVEAEGAEAGVPAEMLPALDLGDAAASRRSLLVADIPPRKDSAKTRCFRLCSTPSAKRQASFEFSESSDGSLTLREGRRAVFVYHPESVANAKVPAGDPRRVRACYVHPLYGLDGETLTDDFPVDHYHHHGLFWAWSHVQIDGQRYDLWVNNEKIQQRFVRWLARDAAAQAAVLGVENGWFIGDRKIMTERVGFRVYRTTDARVIDMDLVLTPTDRPIALQGAAQKGYGGVALRFAPRRDTLITSPDGSTDRDLVNVRLGWADLMAKFEGAPGRSGAAIFASADHPDDPPSWLTRHYGALCIGWPGVNEATLSPGQSIRLSYRLWIHRSATFPQMQAAYQAYRKAGAASWDCAGGN
jgi:hypothetical protein